MVPQLKEAVKEKAGEGCSTPQGSKVLGGASRGFHPRLLTLTPLGVGEQGAEGARDFEG